MTTGAPSTWSSRPTALPIRSTRSPPRREGRRRSEGGRNSASRAGGSPPATLPLAEQVDVDQERAAADHPLAPAEEAAPGRATHRPGVPGHGDGGDAGGRAGGGGERQRPDLAAPELDSPRLRRDRKGPHRAGLDQLRFGCGELLLVHRIDLIPGTGARKR